jgi:CheY-like chemotaxis protein
MIVAPAAPQATTPATPNLAGCRILLAEDGPDNQRLVSFLLRRAGAEVSVAADGRKAMELGLASLPGRGRRYDDPRQPFHVILMDMQMPVMDGYEATRRLREAGYAAPIIALTANAMADDRQKCLDNGCNDFISKPIDRLHLLRTIDTWFRRSPEERALPPDAVGPPARAPDVRANASSASGTPMLNVE